MRNTHQSSLTPDPDDTDFKRTFCLCLMKSSKFAI